MMVMMVVVMVMVMVVIVLHQLQQRLRPLCPGHVVSHQ